MSANYKKIEDYIQPVDVRNSDLKVSHLLGLSIEKCFIESIANTIGTDFKPYKIVKKGTVCLWSLMLKLILAYTDAE